MNNEQIDFQVEADKFVTIFHKVWPLPPRK